jgi:amidase
MDPLLRLDALGLAELVRTRQVSPAELLDATFARIARWNPHIHAVVASMEDEARAAAAAPGDGPFAGVPFLIKDLLAAVKGVPLRGGSALLDGYVPPHDSELVARYRRAGLVLCGKTSTPELGILPTTEARVYGEPCRNPWDLSRSTGGSSGGAAAAVAAGIVPAAHASDGGGSIRVPASACGVFGLKPTRGRNPLGPDVGDVIGGLGVEHVVSRTVRDSAALLDATQGPDVGAPYVAPAPERTYLEETRLPPRPLRLGLVTRSPLDGPVHPSCVAAATRAARLCEGLGHRVEERVIGVPGPMMFDAFMAIWSSGLAMTVEAFALVRGVPSTDPPLEPLTKALLAAGRRVPAWRYLLSWGFLHRVSRAIQAAHFVDLDGLITPTLAEPPPPLGSFAGTDDDPLAGMKRAAAFTPFTALANITGQPAMSLPLHVDETGLPVGVQVVGRFGDEGTLFRLAAQLEAASPWADRFPPAP